MCCVCMRERRSCLPSGNVKLPLGLLRADSGLWRWAGSQSGHPARVLMRCWACPGARLRSLLSRLPPDLQGADAKCALLLYSKASLQWVILYRVPGGITPVVPKITPPTCLAHQVPLSKTMQPQCMIVHEWVKWWPVHLQWRYSPSVLPGANANPEV